MKNVSRVLTLASLLATAWTCNAEVAVAHDFWVQPASFWIAPQTSILTSIQVGHGEFRERWTADASRISAFYDVGPKGVTDHRTELRVGSMQQDHLLKFSTPGTHVLVLQTNHAQSELPGLRFTSYLKDEGMTPALELRAREKTEEMPGREIYSRRAKALVQVGPAGSQLQPQVTRPIGLSLEILPEKNPYTLGNGEPLPVRVIFEGRPLAGALVMLTNLDFDGRPVAKVRTDADGKAVFSVPRTGLWQLNVVWTKPIKGNPKADFDTTFSSLTFGFPRGGTVSRK